MSFTSIARDGGYRSHERRASSSVTCPLCGRSFDNMTDLGARSHLVAIHKGLSDTEKRHYHDILTGRKKQ